MKMVELSGETSSPPPPPSNKRQPKWLLDEKSCQKSQNLSMNGGCAPEIFSRICIGAQPFFVVSSLEYKLTWRRTCKDWKDRAQDTTFYNGFRPRCWR